MKKIKLSDLLKSKELQSEGAKSESKKSVCTQPQKIQEMENFVWDNLTWKLVQQDDAAFENGGFTIINTLYVQWTKVSSWKSRFLFN